MIRKKTIVKHKNNGNSSCPPFGLAAKVEEEEEKEKKNLKSREMKKKKNQHQAYMGF